MKRKLILFLVLAFFGGMFIIAAPTETYAQRSYYVRKVVRNGKVRYVRVPKPSYYRRHRNRINVAGGTVGGAIIGGLLGVSAPALAQAAPRFTRISSTTRNDDTLRCVDTNSAAEFE